MRIFRRIVFWLFAVVDLYAIYATIGYLVLGLKTPRILGGHPTIFMGMYLMSMTFFLVALVLTLILIPIIIKFFKARKATK